MENERVMPDCFYCGGERFRDGERAYVITDSQGVWQPACLKCVESAPKISGSDLWGTCVHETAHAIADIFLLNGIKSVSVIRKEIGDGLYDGHVLVVPFEVSEENVRKYFVATLVAWHASLAAGHEGGVLGDLCLLLRWAARANLDFDKTLDEAWGPAQSFLEENVNLISRVARKLYERKTMTGDEVLAEIAEAQRPKV